MRKVPTDTRLLQTIERLLCIGNAANSWQLVIGNLELK